MNNLNMEDPKFLNILKAPKVLNNKYLASYITGFLESDGCLYVPTKKGVNISIHFAFSKADLVFAEFLKDRFKMGTISQKKDEFSCSWNIYKELDVFKLLVFCNGHFRTPKIGILAKGLEYFKNKYGIDVPVLPLNNNSIFEDGWFAGFSEGDSCFQVCYQKDKTTISIAPYYSLEVAENYSKEIDLSLSSQSNRIFMTFLTESFNTKLYSSIRKATDTTKETSSIRLRITRESNIKQLIQYLNNFPIFSSKYLNFIDLATIFSKKLEAKQSGLKLSTLYSEFKIISDGMNSKRVYYNWDHLNSFYSLPNDIDDAELL